MLLEEELKKCIIPIPDYGINALMQYDYMKFRVMANFYVTSDKLNIGAIIVPHGEIMRAVFYPRYVSLLADPTTLDVKNCACLYLSKYITHMPQLQNTEALVSIYSYVTDFALQLERLLSLTIGGFGQLPNTFKYRIYALQIMYKKDLLTAVITPDRFPRLQNIMFCKFDPNDYDCLIEFLSKFKLNLLMLSIENLSEAMANNLADAILQNGRVGKVVILPASSNYPLLQYYKQFTSDQWNNFEEGDFF